MKSSQFLKEGFVEDANDVHADHEVQMARSDCFHAAEDAIALHKLLRHINEHQGIEGWVSAKLTLASDYLKTVREYLEYEMLSGSQMGSEMSIAEGLGDDGDNQNLSELQAELKKLKAQFDPDFEFSDDHSFWKRQTAIKDRIQTVQKLINQMQSDLKETAMGNPFLPGITDTEEYKQGLTGKLPVPYPEGTQQYTNYYKGVIDKASPFLSKVKEQAAKLSDKGAGQSSAISQEKLNQLYAKGKLMQFIKNTPVALVPLAKIDKIATPQQVQKIQQALGSVDQTSYTDEYKNKGYVVFQWNGTTLDLYVASPEVVSKKYIKFDGQLPQDERSRGKIPSLVALSVLGIDPSKVPFFVKKVPTQMVRAKQLGLEGKTIETSWGEQTVSPGGFMVREENGHIYTVAPDAQGLPIGYVPAQQGVAEGAEEHDIVNSRLPIKHIQRKLQEAGLEKDIRIFLQWAIDNGSAYIDDAIELGEKAKLNDPQLSFGLHRLKKLSGQGMAEEASPMIKPPANRFDDKQEAFAYARTHGGKVFKKVYTDPNTGRKQTSFVVKNEDSIREFFEPTGGGNPPRGPRGPRGTGGGGDDDDNSGNDPYSRPTPKYYNRSINYFGKFEADHFDDEVFDEKTGVFKGYWDDEEGRVQIAYFKFDDPSRTGDDDPGMGWYYEPVDEGINKSKKQYSGSVKENTAGSVAGVVNPSPKNKAKVGTLFGGTYQPKNKRVK